MQIRIGIKLKDKQCFHINFSFSTFCLVYANDGVDEPGRIFLRMQKMFI
jgi:hypothetical protein